jgi:hypothetical protein
MRTVRGVCDWKRGRGLIQRVDDNIFVSNMKFIVKNPADVLKFLARRGFDRKSLLPECVYRFGFEKGSRGYDGLRFACEMEEGYIREGKIEANPYDGFTKFTDVDRDGLIELSVGEDFDIPDGRNGALSLVKLDVEGYGSLVVPKKIHEYIVGNTGADRFLIGKSPVIYERRDEYVGCLAPQFMTFNEEGESIAPGLWFESLHKRE